MKELVIQMHAKVAFWRAKRSWYRVRMEKWFLATTSGDINLEIRISPSFDGGQHLHSFGSFSVNSSSCSGRLHYNTQLSRSTRRILIHYTTGYAVPLYVGERTSEAKYNPSTAFRFSHCRRNTRNWTCNSAFQFRWRCNTSCLYSSNNYYIQRFGDAATWMFSFVFETILAVINLSWLCRSLWRVEDSTSRVGIGIYSSGYIWCQEEERVLVWKRHFSSAISFEAPPVW